MSEKEFRILQAIECNSMVSSWHEYLCLEMRDGRAVLSHRRYEMLGEVSDFAVETEEGEQEYRIPDVIDGKAVVGTDDGFIMGGELTEDPSDPEPEIDLADADPERVRGWLTERGFDPELGSEAALAKMTVKEPVPGAQYGEELEESDDEGDVVEPISAADIGPVTQIRVRLQRWREFPATPENDYLAEVIKEGDAFHYRARGITVPITADEALQVISNPFLYYFSTALKLHKRIDQRMAGAATAGTHSNPEAKGEQKTEGKREAVLLRIDDPFCEREFTLIRTSRNRYALRFSQVYIYKEDRIRLPQARGLKSGAEIWEALVGMVTSLGACELAEDDVDGIAANVAMINSELADEVRRAASQWFVEWNC